MPTLTLDFIRDDAVIRYTNDTPPVYSRIRDNHPKISATIMSELHDIKYLEGIFPKDLHCACVMMHWYIELESDIRFAICMGINMATKKRSSHEKYDWIKEINAGKAKEVTENGQTKVLVSLDCFLRFCLYTAGFEQESENVSKIPSIIIRFYAGDRSVLEGDDVDFNRKICRVLVAFKNENKGELTQDSSQSSAIVKTGLIYFVHPSCFRKGIYKIGKTSRHEAGRAARIQSYGKGTKILFTKEVPLDKLNIIETTIKMVFKHRFKLEMGEEFFSGNKKEMIGVIEDVIFQNMTP